jgi:hypothetical protein
LKETDILLGFITKRHVLIRSSGGSSLKTVNSVQPLRGIRDSGVCSKNGAGRSPEFVDGVDMVWTDLGLFEIGFSGKYRGCNSS